MLLNNLKSQYKVDSDRGLMEIVADERTYQPGSQIDIQGQTNIELKLRRPKPARFTEKTRFLILEFSPDLHIGVQPFDAPGEFPKEEDKLDIIQKLGNFSFDNEDMWPDSSQEGFDVLRGEVIVVTTNETVFDMKIFQQRGISKSAWEQQITPAVWVVKDEDSSRGGIAKFTSISGFSVVQKKIQTNYK